MNKNHSRGLIFRWLREKQQQFMMVKIGLLNNTFLLEYLQNAHYGFIPS